MPFGAKNLGARDLNDYRERRRHRDRAIAVGVAEVQKEEQEAAGSHALIRAQRARAEQLRRTVERKRFLEELGKLSIEEQLQQLSRDYEFPVEWYPSRLAYAATSDVLNGLSMNLRLALFAKLKGRHLGPWGVFKRRLTATLPADVTAPPIRKAWFD